jgi:hypothetical protein
MVPVQWHPPLLLTSCVVTDCVRTASALCMR